VEGLRTWPPPQRERRNAGRPKIRGRRDRSPRAFVGLIWARDGELDADDDAALALIREGLTSLGQQLADRPDRNRWLTQAMISIENTYPAKAGHWATTPHDIVVNGAKGVKSVSEKPATKERPAINPFTKESPPFSKRSPQEDRAPYALLGPRKAAT
jgi:hypothetical protein